MNFNGLTSPRAVADPELAVWAHQAWPEPLGVVSDVWCGDLGLSVRPGGRPEPDWWKSLGLAAWRDDRRNREEEISPGEGKAGLTRELRGSRREQTWLALRHLLHTAVRW